MSGRREFSKAVRRAALLRARGCCEGFDCGAPLTLGKYQFDHINADGLTGKPTLQNCAVLCNACHLEKTRKDVAAIAQAKRREDAFNGTRPPSLKGQGFRRFAPRRRASTPIPKLELF